MYPFKKPILFADIIIKQEPMNVYFQVSFILKFNYLEEKKKKIDM